MRTLLAWLHELLGDDESEFDVCRCGHVRGVHFPNCPCGCPEFRLSRLAPKERV